MRRMRQNPYVFIVGCCRSGTTLLRRIVDAHPHIAITPELHWLPHFFEQRTGLTSEGFVTPQLIPSLLEFPKFGRLQIGRDELQSLIKSETPVSYATLITEIFNLYGKKRGKPLVGNKTPRYAQWLRPLHMLWPTARFVHLIRDGRDVCLSIMNWEKADRKFGRYSTWQEDPVSTAALWWERQVRLGRAEEYELGADLYYEMRYESLLTDPAKECKALCSFLSVPYDDAMLSFHEGRTKSEPGLDAKHAWLPITPGLRDWRTQMAAEDILRFEAAAGDLLEELGYPRAVRSPDPEAQQHAAMIRGTFTEAVADWPDYPYSDMLCNGGATVRAMGQDPHLFIVGCARSGTTLLQRIVNAHSDIAITPEIHWITSFKKRDAGLTPEGVLTKELVSLLLEHERFPQLEISREDFEKLIRPNETLSFANFLRRLFELYGKVKSKRLVGNKTPGYVRNILVIHGLWPTARFVHLIRDGRDVCLSIMNWRKGHDKFRRYSTWNDDPVSTIALWWKRKVRLGREVRRQLSPELYYEMRYEDLMADSAKECEALCQFLAVPYDEAMLRFHEGQKKKRKKASLPIRPGLRDWRTQMTVEDVERFEAVAGDLLDELGYPRAVPHPKREAQNHASLIYDIFTQDAYARGHLLPKGW